jgi:prophage tail gpP-like protein
MEIKEFSQILSHNIRVDIQKLLESFLDNFDFGIVKNPCDQIFRFFLEFNEVLHSSELLLR